MNLFRLHIRPKGGLGDPKTSFTYCLKNSCLGLGWAVNSSNRRTLDWPTYFELAKEENGIKELSRVIFFKENVKVNDLIWTRDEVGGYYLARVVSDWQYLHTQDAFDADILNIVSCDLRKVENIDDVPGKVIACFRPTRTIQRIKDETSVSYSQFLWNDLSASSQYKIETKNTSQNLFSLLTSEQCEDIVFIFLQTLGWIVVPSSRKINTMNYEYYLIHRETKRRAKVQVKTGNTGLNADEWKDPNQSVFLFQANGNYLGTATNDVILLSPQTLEQFARENPLLLPANINRWIVHFTSNSRTSTASIPAERIACIPKSVSS
jgi:hypothetical protein